MSKLVVNFCPTGSVGAKDVCPWIPLSPSEIVDCTRQACEMGITIVHLHARDQRTSRNTSDVSLFAETIRGIRAYAPDLVICVSLTSRGLQNPDLRDAPLALTGDCRPDMGSLTLSSVDFLQDSNVNEISTVKRLATRMRQLGIKPELEIFDTGMANVARYLLERGVLEEPLYCNIILGNISTGQANLGVIDAIVRQLPSGAVWSLGGIGGAQLPMNSVGVAMGGGVRVGLEDNLWLDRERQHPATNSELLRRVHCLAAVHDREVMTSGEFRSLMGLQTEVASSELRRSD